MLDLSHASANVNLKQVATHMAPPALFNSPSPSISSAGTPNSYAALTVMYSMPLSVNQC